MNRYERVVVRRIVEIRSMMLDAIHADEVHQYDGDIRMMRHTIDELLDLLVEFSRPTVEERAKEDG